MNGKKVKALRRLFRARVGRAPHGAAWGGKVQTYVTPAEGDLARAVAEGRSRVVARVAEKVVAPSEWRRVKRAAKA